MAPKILITGLNGYLAGRTAEAVLKAGYDVRGTVRRLATGDKVKDALAEMGYPEDRIDVVEVPDMTVPGAFDEAVKGCHAILHLAAPLGELYGQTTPPEIVRKTVSSTQGLLESAERHAGDGLASVVYMSSVAAMFEVEAEPRRHDETDWNKLAERAVEELGVEAGPFNAYCAAKTASEKTVWRFREEKKPKFGMTAVQARYVSPLPLAALYLLHPLPIHGPKLLATSTSLGPPVVPWPTKEQIHISVSQIWQVVAGAEPMALPTYQFYVDVRDVARVLVWAALHPEAADGERLLCSGGRGGGQAFADILAKHVDGKKEWDGIQLWKGTPNQGYTEGYGPYPGELWLDAGKAVRVTGQDWMPLETSVIDSADVLKRYL
ncbi:NAD-dependent epimerase/dehydratase terH [Apiospora saccharicola]